MKTLIAAAACVAIVASTSMAQVVDNIYNLTVPVIKNGTPQEGGSGDTLCEDLQDLTAGPLDGQVSSDGVMYLGNPPAAGVPFDAGPDTVVNMAGDLMIRHENVLGDDGFGDTYELVFTGANGGAFSPMADDGLVIELDYTVSDVLTDRFYTPIDAVAGFIFTRLGDTDNDGNWDVLETNGAGGGVFFATGIAIPMSGHIEFNILDQAMDIFVNGTMIYSGGIIGSNGDLPGGVTLEVLTNMDFEATSNFTGLGSVQFVNNIEVNGGCGGGCTFALGDVNNDGTVSLTDVAAFVTSLTGGAGAYVCEADINADGLVSLLDVQPFVSIITGG